MTDQEMYKLAQEDDKVKEALLLLSKYADDRTQFNEDIPATEQEEVPGGQPQVGSGPQAIPAMAPGAEGIPAGPEIPQNPAAAAAQEFLAPVFEAAAQGDENAKDVIARAAGEVAKGVMNSQAAAPQMDPAMMDPNAQAMDPAMMDPNAQAMMDPNAQAMAGAAPAAVPAVPPEQAVADQIVPAAAEAAPAAPVEGAAAVPIDPATGQPVAEAPAAVPVATPEKKPFPPKKKEDESEEDKKKGEQEKTSGFRPRYKLWKTYQKKLLKMHL